MQWLADSLILLILSAPQSTQEHTLTPISQAVINGDVDAARAELEKGADPNGPGEFNRPLIIGAIIRGNLKLLDLFLDYGTDLEDPGTAATPLLYAAAQPSREVLRNLLVAGADVSSRSAAGNGALWAAARKKFVDAIHYHAARGTPIDVPSATQRQTGPGKKFTGDDRKEIELGDPIGEGNYARVFKTKDGKAAKFVERGDGDLKYKSVRHERSQTLDGLHRTPGEVAQDLKDNSDLLAKRGIPQLEVESVHTKGAKPCVVVRAKTDDMKTFKVDEFRGKGREEPRCASSGRTEAWRTSISRP